MTTTALRPYIVRVVVCARDQDDARRLIEHALEQDGLPVNEMRVLPVKRVTPAQPASK